MKRSLQQYKVDNFFKGEIFSAVFGSLVSLGCISIKELARGNLDEAIRKDWHVRLAGIHPVPEYLEPNSWRVSYRYWRGFIQREATISQHSQDKKKPKAFLVHGFGGSIDQFTGLAKELSDDFDVYALDSLGFGHSEKPPLSYNQYLWRDQVVDYIKRHTERNEPFILCGNSIGGFTCASAAAFLEKELSYLRIGVVLMNSAGKIIENAGIFTQWLLLSRTEA